MSGGDRTDTAPIASGEGKRKGWVWDANCVQAQPGGPPRGIRTPDLQNRNLTLYPAALWAEMRFSYYNAAKMVCQDGGAGMAAGRTDVT